MNVAGRVCQNCGDKLFNDAPKGLCPACLLDTALDLFASEAEDAIDPPSTPCESRAVSPAKVPGDLGDYELLEEIGRGGQAVVYRARQKSLNRTVALKIIGLGPAAARATKEHLKRFRIEAEAAASLDHPYIVPIHEIGESDGSCYFSMALVEGGKLDEVVRDEPMALRRAAELIARLARTVHYAHEHGILHRDIKPGNILLDANGEPHLTDFGLARLVETESTVTHTMEVLGTPSYMAPEQAKGNNTQLTSATDVYGLGAVLYQLLTGHPPFVGGTTFETVRLVLETEPRQPRLWNPKVDRDLSTICLKCLEKDPQHRYSSAVTMAEDLECWLRHKPIQARRTRALTRGRKWARRNPTAAALIGSLLALAAALAVIIWQSELIHRPAATGIAVLPFENLSYDKEDASFADGVQDDLLTKLANVADLKVISRTSVMQYRGERNTRQIGQALGVSHVLEGSVRKTGAWLHINAQLIDTRTDSHVWAKQYDSDLKNMFAIQSEIAQKVAEQLHAKISPAEKLAIERPPTANLTAFDLYSRAKNLIPAGSYRTGGRSNLFKAADLLDQAVTHDPTFFQAYCQLAYAHDLIHFLGFDHTPARLALAEAAVQAAFRLRPDAGEAHLARAENLYRGHLDYEGALGELKLASQTLPNDARPFALKGYIERRRPGGNQEQALRNLEHAIELDPRNFWLLQQTSLSYDILRRYREEEAILDRMLAVEPNDPGTKAARAFVQFDWKADTRPLRQVLDEMRAQNPSAIHSVADSWLACALAQRDSAGAVNALAALGENTFGNETVKFSPRFVEGLIARLTNDETKARFAFSAARAEQEKIVQALPSYGPALCVLGLIDAGLGRKEEALREGRRAIELLRVEKDAINGTHMIEYFAVIAAWVGDKDLACEELAAAVRLPSLLSFGKLKLLPFWDPLRGDPRFEKIVASLAPKSN